MQEGGAKTPRPLILPNPTQQRMLEEERRRDGVTTRLTHHDTSVQGKVSSENGKKSPKRERRSKACTNCRRSKVKCEKSDSDQVCKRCRSQGLQCVYEYKIASYKVVGTGTKPETSLPQLNTLPSHRSPEVSRPVAYPTTRIASLLNPAADSKVNWQSSVEDRLSDFDSKLGNIISLLQRQSPEDSRLPRLSVILQNGKLPPLTSLTEPSEYASPNKRRRIDPSTHVSSLDHILSRDDARALFKYFDTNISSQLFGFSIGKYSVDYVWENCPFLVATICCIASIHHPVYSQLFVPLEELIRKLSKEIFVKTPSNEMEAFNTIMALCFCGFWFQKDQMFTGLAIQLAKSVNLISPLNKNSKIPRNDRVKLWYLLYILDGQQSLVFNREAIVDSRDRSLVKDRKLLLGSHGSVSQNENSRGYKHPARRLATNYSDLRLVSQVEYHQAIDCAFSEEAWDLLAPASFGLPFKTNLELERWMVQWTVLLSPLKSCPTWSSKSTLIYYNFAKMHINSTAVRKLQIVDSELPRLEQCDADADWEEDSIKLLNGDSKAKLDTNGNAIDDEDGEDDDDDEEDEDEDEDDDDDELVSQHQQLIKAMSPIQSKKVSSELALSAAETVLNIVLGDPDILSALKYVPIHIHIMLYYAALLVLSPPSYLAATHDKSFKSSLKAIQLVKGLRLAVLANSPTDRDFAKRLVGALTSVLEEKVASLKQEIRHVGDNENKLQQVDDVVNRSQNGILNNRQPHKIMAWPGYDSGHPDHVEELE
ncbi:DEKNAAC102608 [Brettanomyces naardenensis]|uniref:DEKNAAC102608 n=1 Tax=Brettanomyces naardenensis TaxID=13370 RepID=A0A448YKI1_BRENA|nr:DEKNAAC102608 [Brettanomyces naardenensis]